MTNRSDPAAHGGDRPTSWMLVSWPGNPRVRGVFTSREGGVSRGRYGAGGAGGSGDAGGMNLASHVGDDASSVRRNRASLRQRLGFDALPWLEQVHGTEVADLDDWQPGSEPRADAALSTRPGVAAGVLVADCLPVLFAAPAASGVAAAHAGWRGLLGGVLERTAEALARRSGCERAQLQAWLGPAIGPAHFEVGDEVRQAFVERDACAARAFAAGAREGKWMADLFELARMRLQAAGLPPESILGGGVCTVSHPDRYYSFRRDGVTGRQAGAVWLVPPQRSA